MQYLSCAVKATPIGGFVRYVTTSSLDSSLLTLHIFYNFCCVTMIWSSIIRRTLFSLATLCSLFEEYFCGWWEIFDRKLIFPSILAPIQKLGLFLYAVPSFVERYISFCVMLLDLGKQGVHIILRLPAHAVRFMNVPAWEMSIEYDWHAARLASQDISDVNVMKLSTQYVTWVPRVSYASDLLFRKRHSWQRSNQSRCSCFQCRQVRNKLSSTTSTW